VRLAVAINRIIEDQHLSQLAAARRLNVNQPKISALSNYRLEGFSIERLMNFLTALDRDVDIVVRRKPKSGRTGRILVTAAWVAKGERSASISPPARILLSYVLAREN